MQIKEATGAKLHELTWYKKYKHITSLANIEGFLDTVSSVLLTDIINREINKLSKKGGGVLEFPEGEFHVYTIILRSNVLLRLSDKTILQAAVPSVDEELGINEGNRFYHDYDYVYRQGEGGNYLEPEVEPYVGLQDHGHTYFANSLIYAKDEENIGIIGGIIRGCRYNPETNATECVLFGSDPNLPDDRLSNGHKGLWYGNKGIAFQNCTNVVLEKFSMIMCGHFAIIAEGVQNMLVDSILVDTNRDALDIDCCSSVTIRNSTFNSLTDDGIVLKSSFGAKKVFTTRDILIEECMVMGYDAGSVFDKTFTSNKLVAEDLCGPTGRIKLGTESTFGYEQITIRKTKFQRSRGFALEAVDGAPLSDVIFEDCQMIQVSSSPLFIKAGDRGRFPVTGRAHTTSFPSKNDIRLDNPEWVLPRAKKFKLFPARRYVPSLDRSQKVTVDGIHGFYIVNQKTPTKINENLIACVKGSRYPLKYEEGKGYVADKDKEPLTDDMLYRYGNACGYKKPAKISNILIRNVIATDVDPRYPLLFMGMTDVPLENIRVEDVSVSFNGGMKMKDAVEQKQLFKEHAYSQNGTEEKIQNVPVYVNPFFLKYEGLLPRKSYDVDSDTFVDDPFNIPELSDVYPEPSNWGILPAYGIYARHVRGLVLKNIDIKTKQKDERCAIVLDDVKEAVIDNVSIENQDAYAEIITVENRYKRHTGFEYVLNEPYFTTKSENIDVIGDTNSLLPNRMRNIVVSAPSPGTPSDELYPYPTISDEVKIL